jgi:hypothetical protein
MMGTTATNTAMELDDTDDDKGSQDDSEMRSTAGSLKETEETEEATLGPDDLLEDADTIGTEDFDECNDGTPVAQQDEDSPPATVTESTSLVESTQHRKKKTHLATGNNSRQGLRPNGSAARTIPAANSNRNKSIDANSNKSIDEPPNASEATTTGTLLQKGRPPTEHAPHPSYTDEPDSAKQQINDLTDDTTHLPTSEKRQQTASSTIGTNCNQDATIEDDDDNTETRTLHEVSAFMKQKLHKADKIFDQVDSTTGVKKRVPEGRDQTETMTT